MMVMQPVMSCADLLLVVDEDHPKSLIILEGETQYYQVPCENRPAPLGLIVDTTEGQYVIYVSSRADRPSQASHEFKFVSDPVSVPSPRGNKRPYQQRQEFEVCPKSFTHPTLYLAIRATAHTILRLAVRFGFRRKKNASATRSRNSPETRRGSTLATRVDSQLELIRCNASLLTKANREARINLRAEGVDAILERRARNSRALSTSRQNLVKSNALVVAEPTRANRLLEKSRVRELVRLIAAKSTRTKLDERGFLQSWVEYHRHTLRRSHVLSLQRVRYGISFREHRNGR